MRIRLLAIIVLAGISVAVVQAEPYFKTWSPKWTNQEPLDPNQSGWQWNEPALSWRVWEHYVAPTALSSAFACLGETNPEGPEALGITVDKDVTNASGFQWTGYEIIVTGTNADYVDGSMTSDKFNTIVEQAVPGGTKIILSDGLIADGDVGNFNFGIDIQYGSQFDFSITQTPIPEPASLLLLAAAGLMLRRR